MWSDLTIFTIYTCLLLGLAWWYLRAYRHSAQASRRRVERMLASDTSEMLRREVDYLRRRNDILLVGLFPRGDVFPGPFIEDDPELRALCDLMELLRGQRTTLTPSPNPNTAPDSSHRA